MTLEMIKQIIRIHKPTKILEIGTAIGYSSMQFAAINPQIQVTTIERNEQMQAQASSNFEVLMHRLESYEFAVENYNVQNCLMPALAFVHFFQLS